MVRAPTLIRQNSEDIRWVLDEYGPVLRRYGYEQLYRVWLAAAEGALSQRETLLGVRRVMHSTAAAMMAGR